MCVFNQRGGNDLKNKRNKMQGEALWMKIGVVQPRRDAENYKRNIERALTYIGSASKDLDLLLFPEGFPGPWWLAPDQRAKDLVSNKIEESEAYESIREGLKDKGTIVGFGTTERLGGRLYNSYGLTGPEGLVGVYRKMLPAAFELLAPSPLSQANEVKVWDVRGGKVGVSICWEALFPEIPRAVAKKGAELLLFPTGGMLYDLKPSWRNVWLARAVENVCYVAGNVSIYGNEEGMALIASPEGVVVESSTQGVIVAELDLERIRWLRSIDEELTLPKKYKTVPGLLKWADRIPSIIQ
jgi:predicted amidohydrolase